MGKGYRKNDKGRGYVDSFGIVWDLTEASLCPVCGQPDDFSDCNHTQLSDNEVKIMAGEKYGA